MNEMILDLTAQLAAIRRPSFEEFLKKTRPEYYAQMVEEKRLADEEERQWKEDIANGIINAEGEFL
jgi:hypothetical protein